MTIHWLASYPKSGSTWARMLLQAYHRDAAPDINDFGPVVGDTARHHYQAASVVPVGDLSKRQQAFLRWAALHNLEHATRFRPLVAKTHHANIDILGVRMIPPPMSGRSVYLVRDPRDVAPSFARHMGKTLDQAIYCMADEEHCIGNDGHLWHFLSSWSNHVRSWGAGEPEVTLVRFEDMVADTADALERMLVTYNIRPDAARIERAVAACHIDRLREQEAEHGFIEVSPKAGRFFGGTQGRLTDEQRRVIENQHGEMMAAAGY